MKEYISFMRNTFPAGVKIRRHFGRLVSEGKLKIIGLENFPRNTLPLLMLPNHPWKGEEYLTVALPFLNPWHLLYPRKYGPWTMAAVENYPKGVPGSDRLILVDRSKPSEKMLALRTAGRKLKAGESVICFAEGHSTPNCDWHVTSDTGELLGQPLTEGISMLARVPNVTTIAMWWKFYGDGRVALVIGKPRKFAEKGPREEVTEWLTPEFLGLANRLA